MNPGTQLQAEDGALYHVALPTAGDDRLVEDGTVLTAIGVVDGKLGRRYVVGNEGEAFTLSRDGDVGQQLVQLAPAPDLTPEPVPTPAAVVEEPVAEPVAPRPVRAPRPRAASEPVVTRSRPPR